MTKLIVVRCIPFFIVIMYDISMNIVLINGSPRTTRSQSFTCTIVHMLKTLCQKRWGNKSDVTMIDIMSQKISPCTDCQYCHDHWGQCVFNDDMKDIYSLLWSADVMIFVSPIYFNTFPAGLKALIDRHQMVYICEKIHGRPFGDFKERQAVLITIGGATFYESQHKGARDVFEIFLRNYHTSLFQHMAFSGTDHLELDELLYQKELKCLVSQLG